MYITVRTSRNNPEYLLKKATTFGPGPGSLKEAVQPVKCTLHTNDFAGARNEAQIGASPFSKNNFMGIIKVFHLTSFGNPSCEVRFCQC